MASFDSFFLKEKGKPTRPRSHGMSWCKMSWQNSCSNEIHAPLYVKKSFKSVNKYLLIKYENLIDNKDKTFYEILKFIHKLKNADFNLDEKKFKNVLETTDFSSMQKLESEKGFDESMIDKKTGKKIKFFNLGKGTNWKSSLDPILQNKIQKAFEKEMIELNYL